MLARETFDGMSAKGSERRFSREPKTKHGPHFYTTNHHHHHHHLSQQTDRHKTPCRTSVSNPGLKKSLQQLRWSHFMPTKMTRGRRQSALPKQRGNKEAHQTRTWRFHQGMPPFLSYFPRYLCLAYTTKKSSATYKYPPGHQRATIFGQNSNTRPIEPYALRGWMDSVSLALGKYATLPVQNGGA